VELLGLAARIPSQLELSGIQIKVADLDVVHSVLNAVGVSERASAFIIGSMSQLKGGRKAVPMVMEQARNLHLAAGESGDDSLGRAIHGLDDNQSRRVLQGLLDWSAVDQFGQRAPDEVVDRLLRKLRGGDNVTTLSRALELISDLAGISGEPTASLAALRAVVAEARADTAAVDRFEEFLQLIQTEPGISQNLMIDLGLVRGLAYYNGLVFEITHPGSPTPLAGGGRYDGLARALGSLESLPALGFAYNLETLLALTVESAALADSSQDAAGTFVLSDGPESYRHALAAASELRQQGTYTELDVCGQDLSQGMAYARRKGMAQVVMVGRDGQRTNHSVDLTRR
jgi:histidyl-tRNA synthetase